MGITKTDLFTEAQNNLAKTAKVLAHPARVAIIQHLIGANDCINSDLVTELGLAQATISQHLRELKEIGIIKGTIEGARMSYCIDPVKWREIQNQLNDMFNQLQSGTHCSDECCE